MVARETPNFSTIRCSDTSCAPGCRRRRRISLTSFRATRTAARSWVRFALMYSRPPLVLAASGGEAAKSSIGAGVLLRG